jgi:ABC-type dipeptide/oligopeptide/nickel transport system ATPase component
MKGRTVIAIAHRLSTLRNFDRIVVMHHGRVVDDGPPDVLANRPGPYRDLLMRQMMAAKFRRHRLSPSRAHRNNPLAARRPPVRPCAHQGGHHGREP